MTPAPHLPPPACDLKTHHLMNTIRVILLVVAFAVPASIAATLATVVWIVPASIPESVTELETRNRRAQTDVLDPATATQVRQRLWTVYDKRQKLQSSFYPEGAELGIAVMLSSDGWAAMATPTGAVRDRDWEGVDSQGVVYAVERTLPDLLSGVTYVKFAGNNFRVMSFADARDQSGVSAWQVDATSAKNVSFSPSVLGAVSARPVWQQSPEFRLTAEVVPKSSVAVSARGDLAGLISPAGQLIPAWKTEPQLTAILNSGALDLRAVPWKGYTARGTTTNGTTTKKISGWYVAESPTRATISSVGVGDMVIAVGGRAVGENSIAELILSAPPEFSVTVIRGGKEQDIVVRKTPITI